jgi:hypothetical protein
MFSTARRLAAALAVLSTAAGATLSAQPTTPQLREGGAPVGLYTDDFGLPVQLTGFDGWFLQTRTQRLWTPELSFFTNLPSVFASVSVCGQGGCGFRAAVAAPPVTTITTTVKAGASNKPVSLTPASGELVLEPRSLPDFLELPVVVVPEPATGWLLATAMVALLVSLNSRRRGA